MRAERDYLSKVVFPELRERCSSRQLYLVDLDLRWGVTEEEAERGKVLDVVLNEIDRSRPFFIALLGERYGSVANNVPEDTQQAYPWLRDYDGYSLTALEIIHGVLREPKMARGSFFYFRDPRVITQIPERKRPDFAAENLEALRRLSDLKEKIRASGRPVMEKYPCRWDDDAERLVCLDDLGERILEDLWTAICIEYPEGEPDADPLAVERQMHENFAEERSYLHVGRLKELVELTQYVQGADSRPVVITGKSGSGKSAFLANWYRQYATQHPDDFVLAYFIGASPDSTNHHFLLRNMCNELKRIFMLEVQLPAEDDKLSEMLAVMLARIAEQQKVKRTIILIDALDQLLPLESAHALGWLVDYIPRNVRLVISSLKGECLDVLRRRDFEERALPPLSVNEQREIVRTVLGMWGRKLDGKQTAALLRHPEARNPLYLRVALEELRLFGSFGELTSRIDDMPSNMTELFGQVLARLEKDYGSEFVCKILTFVGCSRYGLSEFELLDLLSDNGAKPAPRIMLTRLELGAKMYLVQRGELIGFFHRQLGNAVKERYLTSKDKHAELAEYFGRSPVDRRVDEFPFQLQHAEKWEALAAALSDLDLFQYVWDQSREYEWIGYWLSVKDCSRVDHYYRTAIDRMIEEEGESQNVANKSNAVGVLLQDMSLYSSALPFCERALKINETALGPNHQDVATDLNNLAWLYYLQGRYDEALPLYERALKINEAAPGPNHPDVGTNLNNLAELYCAQGRYDKALQLYRRALKILETALGPNHPDIEIIRKSIARTTSRGRRFLQHLRRIKHRISSLP
jgi:tetratricopeptide (TPR) repeat protein